MNALKRVFPILLGLVLFAAPSEVWAACGLSLNVSNVSINWDLNFSTLAVQFTITKTEVSACNFGIGFTKGGAANYSERRVNNAGATMRYQLYKDNGLTKILKDTPFTSGDDLITGGFQDGANLTQTLVYYLDIPYALATAPTLVKSGTFTDTFVMNVYEGSDPLTMITPVATANVSLTVNVASMIRLSLVSSGGGFDESQTAKTVAMGNLYQGLARTFDIRVRSNAGYGITFSSNNNGNLKPADITKVSAVPYLFYVNSVLLNLSNSKAVPVVGLTGAGQTTLQGLSYPIRMVIGNMGTSPLAGGTHVDVVTITATTTE